MRMPSIGAHWGATTCGHRLATAGIDGAVIVWNTETGRAEHLMQGRTAAVILISYSMDGARLAGGYFDLIRVWDSTTGALLRRMPRSPAGSTYFHVQFSPSNNRLLATSGHGGLLLWNVESGERMQISFDGQRENSGAVFSPDGRSIATYNRGELRVVSSNREHCGRG